MRPRGLYEWFAVAVLTSCVGVIAYFIVDDARAQSPAADPFADAPTPAATTSTPSTESTGNRIRFPSPAAPVTGDRYAQGSTSTEASAAATAPPPYAGMYSAGTGSPTPAPPRYAEPAAPSTPLMAARPTPSAAATAPAPQTLPNDSSYEAASLPRSTPPSNVPPPVVSAPYTPRAAAATMSPATSSATIIEGTGRPGEKALEGAQQPSLVIEKLAPAEVQVSKPAMFELLIRNAGSATAMDVEVRDFVPQGTQFLSSTPKAAAGAKGELIWNLGTMRPGEESKISVELLPTTEGELGSTATVRFSAGASTKTICTKPQLVVEVLAPRTVLAGDDVPLRIRVSNPGTGVATGVLITEVVPANMMHEAGRELEYEIGELQPNESRELDLNLRAVKPGVVHNLLHAKGDGKLATEAKTQIEVVSPLLAVDIEGPKKRFLDRQATYTVSIANPGTAPAREVELATYLPRGLQFVNADNNGEYDEATHSVRWLLEELPPKERGTVTLTTLPVEAGQQVLRIESSAARGVTAQKEEAVLIEGASAIVFQVLDTADPVEVGGEMTYEVVVANDGSKEATNIVIAATLPDGMKPIDAEGPTRFTISARGVQFQPLRELPAKAETTYRIRVKCLTPGDHRCHVQLTSDESRVPVSKEEGTRVYADE